MSGATRAADRWLPHRGTMVLIDAIVHVGEVRIVCTSSGHAAPGHPLRAAGRLSAFAGIEIAAQAMALHVAWRSAASARMTGGRLASVRDVVASRERLDDLDGPLAVDCVVESVARNASAYRFALTWRSTRVLDGRLVVIMTSMGEG